MNILTKYTLRTLKENKSRTIVTIVGIILSMSMLTSVMVLIASSQEYLKNSVIASYGQWHGVILDADRQIKEHIRNNEDIESYHILENIGYARNENTHSEIKPYYFVAGADDAFFGNMPVKLTEGHLPANDSEIIIPDNYYYYNGMNELGIGQQLTLKIGDRIFGSGRLNQQDKYEKGETLAIREERSFTIVGFYENPSFESWDAPGITALTVAGGENVYPMDIYYNPTDISFTYSIMDIYTGEPFFCDSLTNTTLLRFSGASAEKGYNSVLYGLGGILSAIIIFASISLIYNAFSISISERTRQFGLISSIGATRKQLIHTVITEAVMLCCVGIPVGILAGLAGIGITLKLTQSVFSIGFDELVFAGAEDVSFRMIISPLAIVIAVVMGFMTVVISAYIPARRALVHSAIDSIRQSHDITPERNTIRVNPITARLFGFEGMIAVKNFKRSKRKYRSTVISLFMSIVLFISAYSFSNMLSRSVDSVVSNVDYDLLYSYHRDDGGYSLEEQYNTLRNLDGVTQSSYFSNIYLPVAAELNNVESRELVQEYLGDEHVQLQAQFIFVDDETYENWLNENGLMDKVSSDGDMPVAFTTNIYQQYDGDNNRYYDLNVLKDYTPEDGIYIESVYTDEAIAVYFCDSLPYGAGEHRNAFPVVIPFSLCETVTGSDAFMVQLAFSSKTPSVLENAVVSSLKGMGLEGSPFIYNFYQEYRTNRAIIGIINVFTFGFIMLIACIATANVFNTISTNVNLRRREFAILRSVGMTDSGMRKMMSYECLIYGLKAILLGVPAGVAVSITIHRIIKFGYVSSYILPVNGIIISVFTVLTVVFITMIYATGKINRENTLELLKNENI